MIQGIVFALPVTITVPVVISLLITFCGLRENDPCYFRGIIPDYLFFTTPEFDKLLTEEVRNHCLLRKMSYMQPPKVNCINKTPN
jgi:chitin synthase